MSWFEPELYRSVKELIARLEPAEPTGAAGSELLVAALAHYQARRGIDRERALAVAKLALRSQTLEHGSSFGLYYALIALIVAGAAAASADSIVYANHGKLFLTSPDGARHYQLTFDGGYSSPSQATNGIIGALRCGQLVRMNRSGQLLNAPIDAMDSPGPASSASIGGRYEPRISPDGTRFAYYFYVQNSFDDLEQHSLARHRFLHDLDLRRSLHQHGHRQRVRPLARAAGMADQRRRPRAERPGRLRLREVNRSPAGPERL